MHAPPVVDVGAPGLDFETWEATSFIAIMGLRPVSGSSIGVTVE